MACTSTRFASTVATYGTLSHAHTEPVVDESLPLANLALLEQLASELADVRLRLVELERDVVYVREERVEPDREVRVRLNALEREVVLMRAERRRSEHERHLLWRFTADQSEAQGREKHAQTSEDVLVPRRPAEKPQETHGSTEKPSESNRSTEEPRVDTDETTEAARRRELLRSRLLRSVANSQAAIQRKCRCHGGSMPCTVEACMMMRCHGGSTPCTVEACMGSTITGEGASKRREGPRQHGRPTIANDRAERSPILVVPLNTPAQTLRAPTETSQPLPSLDTTERELVSKSNHERPTASKASSVASETPPRSGRNPTSANGAIGQGSSRVEWSTRRCLIEGCQETLLHGWLCHLHSDRYVKKRCSNPHCQSLAHVNGKCRLHGGVLKCSEPECWSQVLRGGKCVLHVAPLGQTDASGDGADTQLASTETAPQEIQVRPAEVPSQSEIHGVLPQQLEGSIVETEAEQACTETASTIQEVPVTQVEMPSQNRSDHTQADETPLLLSLQCVLDYQRTPSTTETPTETWSGATSLRDDYRSEQPPEIQSVLAEDIPMLEPSLLDEPEVSVSRLDADESGSEWEVEFVQMRPRALETDEKPPRMGRISSRGRSAIGEAPGSVSQSSRLCLSEGCRNAAKSRGHLCRRHGDTSVKRICSEPDCPSLAHMHGKCRRHGGVRECCESGCSNQAQRRGGECIRHSVSVFCASGGCERLARRGAFCRRHSEHTPTPSVVIVPTSVLPPAGLAPLSVESRTVQYDTQRSLTEMPSETGRSQVTRFETRSENEDTEEMPLLLPLLEESDAEVSSESNPGRPKTPRGASQNGQPPPQSTPGRGVSSINCRSYPPCSVENCKSVSMGNNGLCRGHGGARRPLCAVEGCLFQVQLRGMCRRHNNDPTAPTWITCSVKDCRARVFAGTICRRHQANYKNKQCSEPQCTAVAQLHGKCKTHDEASQCNEPGCSKRAYTGSKCRRHTPPALCSTEGCIRLARFAGLCLRHSPENDSNTR